MMTPSVMPTNQDASSHNTEQVSHERASEHFRASVIGDDGTTEESAYPVHNRRRQESASCRQKEGEGDTPFMDMARLA